MKIKSKKIENYQGIVYDLTVDNTHTYNVYGCAVHNSVAGSLVAWSLGLTAKACDPIKAGLYFERFLSPGRFRIDIPFPKDL